MHQPPSYARKQQGSSMVEMAIVVTLFFGLVFAIIEFALAVFYANRLIDATRAGARYAVVSTPLLTNMDCGALPTAYAACDSSLQPCVELSRVMNAIVPIPIENILYRYQCTQIGGGNISRVYSVSIKVSGMAYAPITPNLLFMSNPDSKNVSFEIDMPEFETTRSSEDHFGR